MWLLNINHSIKHTFSLLFALFNMFYLLVDGIVTLFVGKYFQTEFELIGYFWETLLSHKMAVSNFDKDFQTVWKSLLKLIGKREMETFTQIAFYRLFELKYVVVYTYEDVRILILMCLCLQIMKIKLLSMVS